MIPDDRSIRERLVDRRALTLAQVPGWLLENLPMPPSMRYGVPRPGRFTGEPRPATGIADILSMGEVDRAAGSHQGTSRPSLGLY